MGIITRGRVHSLFDAKQITERFRKREFVLELGDNPRYPQLVLFQLTGDRCEALDAFEKGDTVQVEFSLRGREWKSPQGELKYFNSLDVWNIEADGASTSFDEEPPIPEGPPPGTEDEIPF
jgi:hypothetical protein